MADDLFRSINKVKDPNSKTDLEKKHYPTIDAPDSVKAREPFKVTITVGKELAHPDEGGHYIQWIELYAGEAYLARFDFTPTMTGSPVTITLKLNEDTTLRAIERCNLHGLWEGSKAITVAALSPSKV